MKQKPELSLFLGLLWGEAFIFYYQFNKPTCLMSL